MGIRSKGSWLVAAIGALTGIIAAVLVRLGNPGNMGLCIVCFFRDTAGALGLHRAAAVQYIRPEIIGVTMGAFIMAVTNREFRAKGGSAPLTRFIMGIFVVVGALVFLGCPLRMVLRLAGGDLNALVGLAGFVVGIYVGLQFLRNGFSLGRSNKLAAVSGYILPVAAVGLLVLLVTIPPFIFFSAEGPGFMHAPWLLALASGVTVGILAQR